MTVHFEVRGDVAVLQMDNPPVNGLNHATRQAAADGLARALADPAVRVIVLTGTDRVFSGGADVREFETPAALAAPNLLQLIVAFEAAAKPVVAAINGVAMGGGLELALACTYRVCTPKATMGLPEVKLGLTPGAGGTQRLPRVVGAEQALTMIVSGDAIPAEAALACGLVERIVPDTSFQGVMDFAHEVAGRPALPRVRDRQVTLPSGLSAGAFFASAREHVGRQARGLQAPLACVDCIEAAVLQPFEEGLAYERGRFMALMQADESKAMRHAFFAERAAAKIRDVPEGTPLRPIRQVAVVGLGTMGGGIAMAVANAGLPVLVLDHTAEAVERGLATCRGNWEATARKGRLTAAEVDARMARLMPTMDIGELGDADLVIEAVFEDLAVKQQVFRQLDRVMKPGAILATNTSTLDVDAIAAVTGRPQDVVGLHFFSPANVMRLLEVVRAARTAPDVLATVMQFARRLKKVPVVARVCDGFIGNRMIEQYFRQALFLVDEGAGPGQVDGALQRFGMAMGPMAMNDLAGLDIGYAIRRRRYVDRPEMTYSRIGDVLVEAGRLGQKNGRGWYRYAPGQRTPQPDPEVDAMIAAHRAALPFAPRAIPDDEIVDRCIYALVNEGARLLEDGIAQRAGDIDVVYLAGYGFPAARGGPMCHARLVGLDRVIDRMRAFAANPHADPAFWTPAPRLLEAARRGRWD